jgi:rSAM/selenodomain-associated transferase 1
MRVQTVVVMVKTPVMGAVKTRLAREIGVAEAIRFYRTNVARTLRMLVRDPRWRVVLAVAPRYLMGSAALPNGLARIAQAPGDLGQRMQAVFDRFVPHGPTLIIGSDIPGIHPSHIARAFTLLQAHDAAIGPSEDGGYWLIGMSGLRRRLTPFANVRWSAVHTLADTLAGLSGARVAIADTLWDVDANDDWRRWVRGVTRTTNP